MGKKREVRRKEVEEGGRERGRGGGQGFVTRWTMTFPGATKSLMLGLVIIQIPFSALIQSREGLSGIGGSVEGGIGEFSTGQLRKPWEARAEQVRDMPSQEL